MDKHWFSIDQSQFRTQTNEKIGQVTVVSSTSPYSVPNAVTAYADGSGRYFFEARYIGPEEPVEAQTWENCKFVVGKNSRRLFKLALNKETGLNTTAAVIEKFNGALSHLATGSPQPVENVEVVRKIFEVNKNMFEFADKLTLAK